MVIRRTPARSLADIIAEYLDQSGLTARLKERELIRSWDEVVGKTISRTTQSIYIKDRKLIVTIRSSVVRNELLMIRDGLRDELNRRTGANLIDEIVIR
jgi:predicted nucleic acid-binding Zn ribbon protein